MSVANELADQKILHLFIGSNGAEIGLTGSFVITQDDNIITYISLSHMTNKTPIHLEQLYQELLSQDPSLVSQKSKILGLLTRMTEHTPSVSIDPLFKNNLKTRLRHHITYIHTAVQQPIQSTPKLDRLARVISYGLPALAIGVIVFIILPYNPSIPQTKDIITPSIYNSEFKTSPQSIVENISSSVIQDDPIQKSVQSTEKNIGGSDTITIQSEGITSHDDKDLDVVPTMLKTISIPEGGEDTIMIQDITSSKRSIPLLPTLEQKVYTTDTLTVYYNLYRSGEDIQFEGMIDHCKNSYTISDYLVAVSSHTTLHIIAKNTTSDKDIKLIVTFQDSIITHIEGFESCK